MKTSKRPQSKIASVKTIRSDYDEFVSKPSRKRMVVKAYEELTLSEVVHELMLRKQVSVRALAEEIGVSPTVVQDVRSKKRRNLTLHTLFGITQALGATIRLDIGDKVVTLME